MTPEEVVRAELAAWHRLDLDEILSYFAPAAVWENVPIGAVSGRDEIRREAERWLGQTGSFDAEIVNVAVAGNVVLTERVDHTEFQGAQYHARVMGAFEIDGDKITAWRDYFDMPNDGG